MHDALSTALLCRPFRPQFARIFVSGGSRHRQWMCLPSGPFTTTQLGREFDTGHSRTTMCHDGEAENDTWTGSPICDESPKRASPEIVKAVSSHRTLKNQNYRVLRLDGAFLCRGATLTRDVRLDADHSGWSRSSDVPSKTGEWCVVPGLRKSYDSPQSGFRMEIPVSS